MEEMEKNINGEDVTSKWVLPTTINFFKLNCVFISPNRRNGEDIKLRES